MKQDIENYRSIFCAIDKDSDGKISSLELQDALQTLEVDIQIDTIAGMIDLVDRDHDAHLNLKEFIHFLYICENGRIDDYKSILFLASDDNYSMVINKQRFQYIMQKINLTMDDEEVLQTFKQYADKDDDTMSYDVFLEIVDEMERNK
ncbi:EF_hand domain-containing protein [Hexamita inflata]|uniref:EF hand domain-containing protein n=1 Tax=Hexamita inflata TaxID=28002 RepID=A0AA86PW86_9EUKA|nr:EF hand domain-containing protein [Hexamita inflata]CAI9947161.1 EF hand domain-containing protein [Hexamita inflata]